MVAVDYKRGVHLPEAGLWLDPRDPRDLAFVSHAHRDHTGFHKRILCTPATARLIQVRLDQDARTFETLAFGETRMFVGWSARLLPAGHVLGSAQLLYEASEGTLLYTGDFKLRKGFSSEAAVANHAETLVMETTYGLPRYQFPPVRETLAAVVKFCAEALEDGETPVLLSYALGKAQEILSALQGTKLPVMLHAAIARIAKVYEEFGIAFRPTRTSKPPRPPAGPYLPPKYQRLTNATWPSPLSPGRAYRLGNGPRRGPPASSRRSISPFRPRGLQRSSSLCRGRASQSCAHPSRIRSGICARSSRAGHRGLGFNWSKSTRVLHIHARPDRSLPGTRCIDGGRGFQSLLSRLRSRARVNRKTRQDSQACRIPSLARRQRTSPRSRLADRTRLPAMRWTTAQRGWRHHPQRPPHCQRPF